MGEGWASESAGDSLRACFEGAGKKIGSYLGPIWAKIRSYLLEDRVLSSKREGSYLDLGAREMHAHTQNTTSRILRFSTLD